MKIRLAKAAQLTMAETSAWTRFHRADPTLHSPYFHPLFAKAVAAVRHDVEVAVLEESGEIVGFFPFHRDRWDRGRPVGMRLSDLHGVILARGVRLDARELISGCRLKSWRFDHLLAAQEPFVSYHGYRTESPYMDLGGGFDAYLTGQRQGGSRLIPEVMRKARKMKREVGPVRFEWHTGEQRVLDTLIHWKAEQRKRTKSVNTLGFEWVLDVLNRIRHTETEEFAGLLSALYVGDQLAAAHLGMRSKRVLHYWFPTFNRTFGQYSPGLILLLEMARAAASVGIDRIDLGKGDERYKTSLRSGTIAVAEGSVRLQVGRIHQVLDRGREWVRSTPPHGLRRALKQRVRRFYVRFIMR